VAKHLGFQATDPAFVAELGGGRHGSVSGGTPRWTGTVFSTNPSPELDVEVRLQPFSIPAISGGGLYTLGGRAFILTNMLSCRPAQRFCETETSRVD
jgi:hypothetical protein